MRTILIILLGVILAIITPLISYAGEENPGFNPHDLKVPVYKTISDILETARAAGDTDTIENIMVYSQKQMSEYALLILMEFYDDLSKDRLDTIRQYSPEQWQMLKGYLDKAMSWLSLTKKADTFLGNQLGKTLKAELGEQP
jgi:hypothetical protein